MLVVEDNIVHQKVAVWTLEKLGCRVDVAANGEEALSMMDLLRYDLIFMDCQMPQMDGFEATAQIRRKEESLGGRIPIVGLTSNAMKGDRERCLDAGMNDHIAKPVRIEKLRKAVETYGRRRFAENSAPETREDRHDVFDRAEVLERVGGDREFFNELVALFRADCRKLLSETREAVSRKDCKALELPRPHLERFGEQLWGERSLRGGA